MYEKAVLIQPNEVKSQAPNKRRDINIFSLTTSNRLTEKQKVGGAFLQLQLGVLSSARIVCTSSSCDAVIRRPGRIWGVWESHERNDAILGNQFLAGDNTSRTRTCFIKQYWL